MVAMRLFAEGAEGPNTELAWLVYVVMGFLLLAVAAGWASRIGAGKQAQGEREAGSPLQRDDPARESQRRQVGVPRMITARKGKSGRKIR